MFVVDRNGIEIERTTKVKIHNTIYTRISKGNWMADHRNGPIPIVTVDMMMLLDAYVALDEKEGI